MLSLAVLARPTVFVTIAPMAEAVKTIAGDTLDVNVLVPPGATPENYNPDARLLGELSKAKIFFCIGAPCEVPLLPKLREIFPKLKIVDGTEGMHFRKLEDDDHGHAHDGKDPHVWLSVSNMQTFTRNVCNALSKAYPDNKKTYQRNAERYIGQLSTLDRSISMRLAPLKNRHYMVMHPAFGYFFDEYGISQLAVEKDGKIPSGKHLATFIHKARKYGCHNLIVQPQYNADSAKAIVKETGGRIIVLDPLPLDYIAGMMDIMDGIMPVGTALETPGIAPNIGND